MSAQVTLTVTEGSLRGQHFTFREYTMCTVGRSQDCVIHLPGGGENLAASRFHCVFEMTPPEVRVRDLGSRNGTFVNGVVVGRRQPDESPEAASHTEFPFHDLHDGDEVRVAGNVFRVTIPSSANPGRPAQVMSRGG
jgi:pSer/pThr/pTyr-binding forkhead associated (FHA) protein